MDIVEMEDHSIFFLRVVNAIKCDLNERFIASDEIGWSNTLYSLGVLDYGRRGLHDVRPCAVVAAADQGPAALSHVRVSDRTESSAVNGDCGAAIHTAANRGHTRDDGLYIVGEFKVRRDPVNTVQRDTYRVQSVDVFVWRGDARDTHCRIKLSADNLVANLAHRNKTVLKLNVEPNAAHFQLGAALVQPSQRLNLYDLWLFVVVIFNQAIREVVSILDNNIVGAARCLLFKLFYLADASINGPAHSGRGCHGCTEHESIHALTFCELRLSIVKGRKVRLGHVLLVEPV
jgi:hypothetical protein